MGKPGTQQVEKFLQELASLSRSGLPLPEGLRTLAGVSDTWAAQVAQRTAAELERGTPLSEALRRAEPALPPQVLAFLEAGNHCSELGPLLSHTVAHFRQARRHRVLMETALCYPMIVLFLVGLLLLIAAFRVAPGMEDIFRQLGAELPAATQTVMDVCAFLRSPAGLLVAALPILFPIAFLMSERLRDACFSVLSQQRGMGSMLALADTGMLARVLEVLLGRGVPLHITLRAAEAAMVLQATREAVAEMALRAERGQTIAEAIPPHLPAIPAYLMQQGEATGTLPAACAEVARYCEDHSEQTSRRLLAFFEPAVLIAMLLVAGVFVTALYLPLFSLPKIVGR